MENVLPDLMLQKAWEKEDSPERDAARAQTLAYLENGINAIKAMIEGLKEDRQKVCSLMAEESDMGKRRRRYKKEKNSIDERIIQAQLTITILEGLIEWYQRLWENEPLSEKEKAEGKREIVKAMVYMQMMPELIYISKREE